MAHIGAMLLTLAGYKTWLNYTATDRDAVYNAMITEIDDAIKKRLRQPIEQAKYVEYYDAEPDEYLRLRWTPVNLQGLQVIVAPFSGGNPSAFANTTPLNLYTDYVLEVDQPDGVTSRCGLLRRVRYGSWGYYFMDPIRRLSSRLETDPRAVQVTYVAGYAQVPQSITLAAYEMMSKLYLARQMGAQVTSASLNGASYSLPGTNANGLIDSPDVWPYLSPFCDGIGIG